MRPEVTIRPRAVAVLADALRKIEDDRDGQRVAEAASREFQLSDLVDSNNWLGRSQWTQDAFFKGSIGDFRIYTRVLSAAEIAGLFADGP